MRLTQSEREWLENRKALSPFGFYSCKHCKAESDPLVCWTIKRCPGHFDFMDAMEFAERVAAKLADINFSPVADTRPCVRLKFARLTVEEDMDANRI